jgi:predicted Zn-dependent protease
MKTHKNQSLTKHYRIVFAIALLAAIYFVYRSPCWAQFRTSYANSSKSSVSASRVDAKLSYPAGVYPQFRSSAGVIRWLTEQMPLKVYVSRGITLDSILDQNNVPACNVNALDQWPDIVANCVQKPEELKAFSVADGYNPAHFDAAIQGINAWKIFEKEGLFSFTMTDDPTDADIYVFWTNHFVNNLGLGLFANDIRGYTAKRSFWYREILQGKQAKFRPVVIMLRTTDSAGHVMAPDKMRSSASHEFGHALGIEGHSTNPHDLMSIYYGNGFVSPSDAATIRYLYHLQPDLIP